jgi:hypothetical protein
MSCGSDDGKYRDYNVVMNAIYMGQEYLWPVTHDCRTNPSYACECDEHMVEIATCRVEATDCVFETPDGKFRDPKVLKVYEMECLGTIDCEYEGYDAMVCCQLIGPLPSENRS